VKLNRPYVDGHTQACGAPTSPRGDQAGSLIGNNSSMRRLEVLEENPELMTLDAG